MTEQAKRTFGSDFRQFFLRGLVVILPSVLTLWIVVKAYQFVDNTFAEPINKGVRVSIEKLTPFWAVLGDRFDPDEEAIQREVRQRTSFGQQPRPEQVRGELRRQAIREWWDAHWAMDLIGLVVAIISVYIAGRLLGGFVGRRIYRRIEEVITTLPVFKQVYPHVKQIVDFLFSDDRPIKFNRVVVIQYPRKGIWSVGFLTGDTMKSIADQSGESVTVFIPSSPTPFTGYTITVPRDQVVELPISVEEAIRFAVSGGVLVPDHQAIGKTIEAAGPAVGLVPLPAAEEATADRDGGTGPDGEETRAEITQLGAKDT